jgi:hypothetical protein
LGSTLLACGSSGSGTSTKDPIDLVPLDNDVPGWTVDQAHNQPEHPRAMIATNCGPPTDIHSIENLIDGGFAEFCVTPPTITPQQTHVPKEFLTQSYLNSSLPAAAGASTATLDLRIAQMSSADVATEVYTDMVKWDEFVNLPWQDPSTPLVGTGSRIADTGSNGAWKVMFHQDVYYVILVLAPSEPAPDYDTPSDATKQAAFTFAQWIASKI